MIGGEGGIRTQRLKGPCFRWLFLSGLAMCITSVAHRKGAEPTPHAPQKIASSSPRDTGRLPIERLTSPIRLRWMCMRS